MVRATTEKKTLRQKIYLPQSTAVAVSPPLFAGCKRFRSVHLNDEVLDEHAEGLLHQDLQNDHMHERCMSVFQRPVRERLGYRPCYDHADGNWEAYPRIPLCCRLWP